jgi:sugar (pentulose or hexulose) kinase
LDILREVACRERFVVPCITELVGYLNWCLTGVLTVNSISLAEMGMGAGAADCESLSVADGIHPQLVAAGRRVGETSRGTAAELSIGIGIPVCGGCPDTLGSVVGAGMIKASETMLYLGTFGSLLHLESDVEELLDAQCCSAPPFRWSLSIPGLGPEVEKQSRDCFGWLGEADRLKAFDLAAEDSQPGAGGSLFLVPRWKNGMTQVGRFELVPDRTGDRGDVSRKARAVLESVGYAVRAIGGQLPKSIKASGGGARSHAWLQALSGVLGTSIRTQHMSWEAAGTADIAARLAWRTAGVVRPWHEAQPPRGSGLEVVEDNYHRAMEIYRGNGWL